MLNDEIAILGPFYAYIAIECNDKNTLIKQELYLRALKPQYTLTITLIFKSIFASAYPN